MESQSRVEKEKFYFTPTLVISCGAQYPFQKLQEQVNARLTQVIDSGIVRWSPIFDPGTKAISRQSLEESLSPFFRQEFWLKLVEGQFVEQLPDNAHPLRLQFLVLCDCFDRDKEQVFVSWLENLSSQLKSIIGERADYSLSLLVLGCSFKKIDKLQSFWPRFYIGQVALGGTSVSSEMLLQACQSIIVALTTSDAKSVVDHLVGSKRKITRWISLGVS
jgi:hypothetical protein